MPSFPSLSGLLKRTANLADLTSPTTARQSLGLGALATQNFPRSTATTITALGDSISAQSIYAPMNAVPAAIPQWRPATAYALNFVVQNNGFCFQAGTAGTSGTGTGPTGNAYNQADGGVTWQPLLPNVVKNGTSYLFWAEVFSNGRLVWDLSLGRGGTWLGIAKVYVVAAGQAYTNPTITFNGGATGTVQTDGAGHITGVTILSPGYNTTGSYTYALSDPTGSGAVLSIAASGTGVFATSGCRTADMVASLTDAAASAADIVVVHGGINDILNNVAYPTIIANLRNCYETLLNAGKKVIACPPTPSTGLTMAQTATLFRVQRFVMQYVRKEAQANPLGYNIALADWTGYYTDGTNAQNYPIGGTGGTAGAMTQDGRHPSPRGAWYAGQTILQAAQQWLSAVPACGFRPYSSYDAYDPALNPGGNCMEGLPWVANTAYVPGQLCNAAGYVYLCTIGGTSAASGGPTSTSGSIVDGTVTWKYVANARRSVFASGSGGYSNPATGITYSGSLANGYTLYRIGGSATGTITQTIESPWSSGQAGQRQVLGFSLGGGTNAELWDFFAFATSGYANFGFTAADLGTASVYGEMEIEVSNIANMTQLNLQAPTADGSMLCLSGQNTAGTGWHLPASTGEMLPWPNGGKLLLRTQPMVLAPNLSNMTLLLQVGFDASGAAGSATGTIKVNYVALRRAYVN
jgi:hypothetical protein